MTVQEALRRLRAATRTSQSEFAASLGMTASRISQIENGRGGFSPDNTLLLEQKYGALMAEHGLTLRDFTRRREAASA